MGRRVEPLLRVEVADRLAADRAEAVARAVSAPASAKAKTAKFDMSLLFIPTSSKIFDMDANPNLEN